MPFIFIKACFEFGWHHAKTTTSQYLRRSGFLYSKILVIFKGGKKVKKNLVPYYKVLSGDMETPITLFKKFVGEKQGILLESYDTDNNKFSFIAKNPYSIIKGKRNKTIIEENSLVKEKKGKSLDVIKDYISEFEVKNTTQFPFIGGAVGYLAYDIIRQYEKLPDTNQDVLKFPDVHLMIITEMIIYDHLHNKIIFLVLEESNEEGKKRAEEIIKVMEAEIKSASLEMEYSEPGEEKLKFHISSNISKEEFITAVEKAKGYIYEGDIFQVVLSQRWKIESKEKPFRLYRKLRELNPSQYLFYINFGDYQVLGSSPEMLVKLQNNRVFTCPIAGTRKRGSNFEEDIKLSEDLLRDEKERAEHVMLVDLARNDMGKVCDIGSIKLNEFMKVRYYSHVMHLVSLVEGSRRKDKDSFDILASLIPAGTLSGAPKIRAMEIIEELEKEKRGAYGGAVGYFGFDGNMDMCIAIRMMIIKNKKAYIQAGAGIVADSIPEKEYEETENKARALIKVFGGN